MRIIIFAGIFALSASTSLAQTGTAPAPAAPEAETAAPADPAAAQPAAAGGPANLCQELLAFMKAPPPEAPAAPAAAPAKSAEAKNAPAGGQGAAAPAPASATQGNVRNAPQTSSLSAPVPTEPASTPKESVLDLTQAQTLAETNDITACRDAARELRLAGVAVPPPLLALAALDLQYHQTGATSPQEPAAPQ